MSGRLVAYNFECQYKACDLTPCSEKVTCLEGYSSNTEITGGNDLGVIVIKFTE